MTNTRLISILIPAYRSANYLEDCVHSVLSQDLPEDWSLEVIVGVDGCKETLKKASELSGDPRLTVLQSPVNVGAYITRNSLSEYASGEYIGVFDSDDIMLPWNLKKCIEKIRSVDKPDIISYPILIVGEDLTSTGVIRRGGDGTALFHRRVINSLGGWEAWPCGADSEFLVRAECWGFRRHVVDFVGHLYRQHGNQLTQVFSSNDTPRKNAREVIKKRRFDWKSGVDAPKRITPVRTPLHPVFTLSGQVHVCMATIPSRIDTFKMVCDRILQQLPPSGVLHVCLNGFDSIPAFLNRSNVVDIVLSSDVGDRGDAGKFYWLGKVDGYYLTIDDDIEYPEYYINDLVYEIEKKNREAVVGYHGVDYPNMPINKLNQRIAYPIFGTVGSDRWVHSLGTGCCGFHTSTLQGMTQDDFEIPNMADVWFARYCQTIGVPLLVKKHAKGYLKPLSIPNKECIQVSSFRGTGTAMDTGKQQILVISETPWKHRDNHDSNSSEDIVPEPIINITPAANTPPPACVVNKQDTNFKKRKNYYRNTKWHALNRMSHNK